MKKFAAIGCAVAALGALAGPAAAHDHAGMAMAMAPKPKPTAGAYQVLVGEQLRPPAGVPKTATLNQFFPAQMSVHVGDKVTFTNRGFHTVTFLGPNGKPAPLFVPDPSGAKYDPIEDAAGQPFAFAGQPKLVYNVGAFAPFGGTDVDGRKPVSSGVIAPGPNGKPVNVTLRFMKPGSYRMICGVHEGMAMTIVVKPAGAAVDTPAAVAQRAQKETDAAWAKAAAAASVKVPANTVFAGVGDNATLMTFLPNTLKVKAGTTVTFVADSRTEIHDVAFGPIKWFEAFQKANDLFPEGPNGQNQVSPLLAYGSEPAGGPYVYDGQNHGNGVLVTPLTGKSKALPFGRSVQVQFTKPGTYKYICLLHAPDMAGTIVVTP